MFSFFFGGLLCLALLAIPGHAQTADLEQHLRDQYRGKTFLLRGFYSGDRLHYGPTGMPDKATAGDWTTDGFIEVTEISLSHQRLTIGAKRLIVVAPKGGFQFVADTTTHKKKAPLQIKAELPTDGTPPEQVDTAMSRILLTAQDDFAAMVPDYWRPCVLEGLRGGNAACNFTPELLAVPGVVTAVKRDPASATERENAGAAPSGLSRIGLGVSPPRVIRQADPSFSEVARKAHFQGTATLKLIVDVSGVPQIIHVLGPLGYGLDAQAVRAVGMWKFKPSEKDGQPVPVEISVEVEFRLY